MGEKDGFEVGSRLGNVVGDSEMCVEGSCDGLKDGCLDGLTLGDELARTVGSLEWTILGLFDGSVVGPVVISLLG